MSDFEKSKLAQQDITYDTRIVEANLKLVDKIKERDQLVEQLEKRRAFLKTVKEQTSTNQEMVSEVKDSIAMKREKIE